MKQKVVMKISMHDQKARSKSLKIVVGAPGVESAALQEDPCPPKLPFPIPFLILRIWRAVHTTYRVVIHQNNWIVDTGATDHIIHSIDIFTSITKSLNTYVKLPNGNTVPVTHLGTVKLSDNLILKDVLCEFTPWKMIGIARKSAGLYILQQSDAYAVEFPPKSNTVNSIILPKPVPDYNEIPYPEPLQSEIPSLDSVIPTSTDLPLHDENQFPPLRKSTRQHKMPGYLQTYHCNLAASASQSSTRDPATNPVINTEDLDCKHKLNE
ncbi:hypothetical protein HHK36_002300 [Tetracentron sinense]|uniref:Retrovirus-related Pol polyprotein from transposon TNT 1-94-like beta-barrel domain-containing protein n=1 Tax=Tetracentron sinense TaxID=13715 RepID=A0A835DRU6_TETSI|nr:hypothetical protein HHK36_002300 [Tetracentron sinense]